MFFSYAVHIEERANADEKKGLDRSFYRQHLQEASGVDSAEYAQILEAAQRFITARNAAKMDAATARSYSKRPPKVSAATAGSGAGLANPELTTEIANVRQVLGSDSAAKFETYLQTVFVPQTLPLTAKPTTTAKTTATPANLTAASLATPDNVTIDNDDDNTCHDYTYTDPDSGDTFVVITICAEAQMADLGQSSTPHMDLVELYADTDVDFNNDYVDPYEADISAVADVSGPAGNDNGFVDEWAATDEVVTCNLDTDWCEMYVDNEDGDNPTQTDVLFDYGNDETYKWQPTSEFDYSVPAIDGCYDSVCEFTTFASDPAWVLIQYPQVTSPSSLNLTQGQQASTTLEGNYFVSPFENNGTSTILYPSTVFDPFTFSSFSCTGSGCTGPYSVDLNYTVLADADTDDSQITVSNGFGTGALNVCVSQPAPTISGISVAGVLSGPLQAGTTQTVTLTGANFGSTTPSIVIISGGSGISIGSVSSHSQNSVTFTLTASSNAPAGSLTVGIQVTNSCTQAAQTASAPTIQVVPIPAAAPVILDGTFSDNNNSCSAANTIANPPDGDNTQDVWIGQRNAFTACVQVPTGLSISSSSWTVTSSPTNNFQNDAVDGLALGQNENNAYMNTTVPKSGAYITATVPTCSGGLTYCDFTPVYFILPGQYEFTFNYVLSNQQANSATVTYDAVGPVGTGISNANATSMTALPCNNTQTICVYSNSPAAAIQLVSITVNNNGTLTTSQAFALQQSGIVFTLATSMPSNAPVSYPANPSAFQWVQILSPRTTSYIQPPPTGRSSTTSSGGLDNTYPYPLLPASYSALMYAGDAPAVVLNSAYGETSDQFQAQMYLMWDPSLGASGQVVPQCAANTEWRSSAPGAVSTASTCLDLSSGVYYSIPVPLGSIAWAYCGDAINTLTTQQTVGGQTTGYALNCSSLYQSATAGATSIPLFIPATGSSSFPGWNNVVGNTAANQY